MLRNHARQVPQASVGAIKPMSGAIVHRHSKCPFLPYDPREASHRGTRAIRAADQDVPARVWLSSPPLRAVARRALLVDFQDSTAIRRLPWGDCSSAGAAIRMSTQACPLTASQRSFDNGNRERPQWHQRMRTFDPHLPLELALAQRPLPKYNRRSPFTVAGPQ